MEIRSNPTIFEQIQILGETNEPKMRRQISDFKALQQKSPAFAAYHNKNTFNEKLLNKENKGLREKVNRLTNEIIGLKLIIKRVSEKYKICQKYKPFER